MHYKKEEFEKRLKEFFDRHDPAKADMAHTIASKFHLHQEEVFEHLTDLYDPYKDRKEPETLKDKILDVLWYNGQPH